MNENTKSQHIIDTDLAAYKNAFTAAMQDKAQLETRVRLRDEQLRGLEEQVQSLKDQVKGYRISVIVDGDGCIFSEDLISRGRQGGYDAARLLVDFLQSYLNEKFGQNHYQFWIYVFFNKRGLMEALGRSSLSPLRSKLEDFVVGFNQASTRIVMLDVGFGKEEADGKVKEFLDRDVNLPQTFKVFFAGCHDNGYATTLRSHITVGRGEKLILLNGYSAMAVGMSELGLPDVTIPGLFMENKITDHPAVGSPVRKAVATVDHDLDAPGPPPGLPAPGRPPVSSPVTLSFSAMAQKPADRRASIGSNARTSPPPAVRRLNPNQPLSKQNPRPCNIHYLTGNCWLEDCQYAHDYDLTDNQLEELRQYVKKAPCQFVNNGEPCLRDDDCIYGHTCPRGPTCTYVKVKKCIFKGANMHTAGGY